MTAGDRLPFGMTSFGVSVVMRIRHRSTSTMQSYSVLKFSWTLVPKTEEHVVRHSGMDTYQSEPGRRFRCIAYITVRRRPVDPRLGSLAQDLERNRPKVLIN